jgi:ABC-2 type transport system permease protein
LTDLAETCGEACVQLNAAWAIARKDIRIYYLRPNIIVSGMLFPLFMFLAFAVGRPAEPGTMIPGLVAITILFSASSIEPVSIPIERRMKTFDRLLSAPISLHTVVLGESLSGFLYSLGIAFVPLIAGYLLFGTMVTSIIPLVIGLLLTAFCFATMGTLFAAYPTESPGDIMSMINVVRMPLIFISGIFIPLDQIPEAARFITYLSPLTYGNDLIHAAYSGETHFSPALDVLMLVIFILVFQLVANRLYKKYNECEKGSGGGSARGS